MPKISHIPLLLILLPFAAHAEDWPHWMGPDRDGHSAESSGFEAGLWPPTVTLWKTNLGTGSTSPLVVDGVLYAAGWKNGNDTLVALDAEKGTVLWSQTYPGPEYGRQARGDQSMYRGMTATPEFDTDTGSLYTLSCDGDLRCWNTREKGAPIWALNLYEKYGGKRRPQVTQRKNSLRDYGYTTAPLVLGDQLLIEVGAEVGNLIGFDKRTGKELWRSENNQPAGHGGGLAPITVEGVPCVAVLTARNLHVARVDRGHEGETVAEFPWITDFINNIATPAVSGNRVVITSRYNQDAAACVEITLRGGAREVWRAKGIASGVCSPVIHAGHLHWANKGIHCVDLADGTLRWKGGKITDAGSCIITKDGRMIVWGNGGDLLLCETAERSRDRYTELAVRKGILKDMAWPHVVFANGLLYLKDTSGNLACLSLRETDRGRSVETTRIEPPRSEPKPGQILGLKGWPGESKDLFFAWRRGWGKAKVGGAFAAANPRTRISTRGAADLDREGRFQLAGGGVFLPALDQPLLEVLKNGNALTLETVFSAKDLQQNGPARIISFSDDGYHRNFTLGQERDRLVFRLRARGTDENGKNLEQTFGKIEADREHHVLVTYAPGDLRAYLDGEEVLRSDRIQGDLSTWEPMHFILGDEWSETRDWAGSLSALALWPRVMDAKEAAARYAQAR